MTRPGSLTEELRAAPPLLHGSDEFWGLAWAALAWLERQLRPGMATLETGAGASTIVFAASGAEHEAVTPDAAERARIEAECERRGISTASVAFRIGPSHEVIPSLEPRPLDLALIDGAHGFPYPILDWWHLAPRLRVGALLMLDDAYMPPVRGLLEFLDADPRWEVGGAVSDRTVVVRKLAEGVPPFDWAGERLGGRMSFRYLPPARRVRAALEHRFAGTRVGRRSVAFARRVLYDRNESSRLPPSR
jgi:hypothetical protein